MDEALRLVTEDPQGALQAVAGLDDATLTREIEERLAADTEDWPSRFAAASLYFHRGLLQPAIRHFQETVQVREYELSSHHFLARAFMKDRRFGLDMAVRQFQKVLGSTEHSDEECVPLRYHLGVLLYEHGRLQEALQALQEVLVVDLSYRDVPELVEKIWRQLSGGGDGSGVPAIPRGPLPTLPYGDAKELPRE